MIEWFVVMGASLLLASLNQFHVIIQWLNNPPDRMFTGIAHSTPDYFLYTDLLAQGATGTLWTAAHFTNEPMAKTWIYWFNALLGWMGNLAGLSPFAAYNVSLFLLVVALCLVWYWLVRMIFPVHNPSSPPLNVRGGRVGLRSGGEGELPLWVKRLTAWLMILTASSFSQGGELLGQFWFSPAPALNRLGGVPHQVFQTILFVLLILTFAKSLTVWSSNRMRNYELGIMKKTVLSSSLIRNSIFLILLTTLASSANPIQMVLFIAASLTLLSARVIPLVLVAIPVMIATNKAFDLPVLAAAKAWENAQVVSVSLWQFFLSVGPVALLVPFGIKPFLKEKSPLRTLLVSYAALSLLAFFSPIPKLLGTTNVRWLHPASYAILGILAAQGIASLPHKFPILLMYLIFTLPSLAIQIDSRTNPKYNTILTSDLNHVPRPVVEALSWLKVTGLNPVMKVVLTDPTLPYDVLVPTMTGLPSFTGHPIHTLYPGVKEKLRQDFFAGNMTKEEMQTFLIDHRIGYIVKAIHRLLPPSTLSFLTETYRNAVVAIYNDNRNMSCFPDTCPSEKR